MPEDPPDRPVPSSEDSLSFRAVERIAGYRIVRELGRGGMGVVYEAIQEQLRRTVALKVVTAARASSPEVLKRFEREAEVLGRLQHPGIAQIYEAGHFQAVSGVQSFFAMELVRGEPLNEYAESHALGIEERLDLLARIADAVHHAHERGIIHRDLKPGNVLVNEAGQPKVLDFGVARVTDADLRTVTLQTGIGQVVGTIPYMSPEQASGDPERIDPRSDVYALGVVAYELLTGILPYELDLAHVLEAVRTVREDEARPLSSVDVRLRGDVETIIGKALEKEPDQRYASAAAFADDIRRFLSDEPILARPPSTLYQLRKFARRNRALVAGIAGVFAALVIGLIGTSLGYVEAEHRRREADEAKVEALASAERAERSSRFLTNILSGISPSTAQGADTTLLRAILADTEARIERELAGAPVAEAEIRQAIGLAYSSLSDPLKAEAHLRAALAIFEAELGPLDVATIRGRCQLGSILSRIGRFDEGEAMLREACRQASETLGADAPVTLGAQRALAIVLQNTGRLQESEELLSATLARMRNNPRVPESDYLDSCIPLSTLLLQQDRDDEAQVLLDELLDRMNATLGPSHPVTIEALFNRVALDKKRGLRDEEVLGRLRDLWQRSQRVHGADHSSTHSVGRAYAAYLRDIGRWDEAERILEQILASREAKLGPDDVQVLMIRTALANTRIRQGRLAEAEQDLLRIVPALTQALGADHVETAEAQGALAQIYRQTNRLPEAEPLLREAIASLEGHGGFHGSLLTTQSELGVVLKALGRLDEAAALQREILAARLELDGPGHPDTLVCRTALALTLGSLGRKDEALEQLMLSLEGHRRLLGDDNVETGTVLYNAGMLHFTAGDVLTALPYLSEAASVWVRGAGPEHPNARSTLASLQRALASADRERLQATPEAAESVAGDLTELARVFADREDGNQATYFAELAFDLRSPLDADDPRLAWTQTVLGAALLLVGRLDEAGALLESSRERLDPHATDQLAAADAWLARVDEATRAR